MNSTSTSEMTDPYQYSTIILGILFITSEVLPFLKKNKGNGITDTLICLLRGSSCMAEKLANTIEEKTNPVSEVEQKA